MRARVVLLVREMPDARSHHTRLHAYLQYSELLVSKKSFLSVSFFFRGGEEFIFLRGNGLVQYGSMS